MAKTRQLLMCVFLAKASDNGGRDIIRSRVFRTQMLTVRRNTLAAILLLKLLSGLMSAQAPPTAAPGDASSSIQQAIGLAEKGRCREALPVLKKNIAHVADKQLKYRAAMAMTRCAMSLDQTETTVEALLLLRREFPSDPEVLYVTTHFYSELASRAARELAAGAPSSPQALKLDAEAFESQGKWDEASAEYQKILEAYPQQPEIHYRLGRILLSKSPPAAGDARQQFEEELKIDPANASAEFMLGEIARQAGQWDGAIQHFSRAAKLDDGFLEAFLALGVSLNSAQKFAEAIAPLEHYIKMEPADPAGHYQLAVAYARTGRKAEAARESQLQRETAAKAQPQGQPRDQNPAGPR